MEKQPWQVESESQQNYLMREPNKVQKTAKSQPLRSVRFKHYKTVVSYCGSYKIYKIMCEDDSGLIEFKINQNVLKRIISEVLVEDKINKYLKDNNDV